MVLSARRTATFSQETSIETSSGSEGEEILHTTFSAEVETGPVEAEPGDATTAVAWVDGVAAGTSTLTAGGVGVSVDASGSVSSSSATAGITAAAYSEGDLLTYAAVDASASVSGVSGAGFSLSWNSTSFSQDAEGTSWTATSMETVSVVGLAPGLTQPAGGCGQHACEQEAEWTADAPSADAPDAWSADWTWSPEEDEAGFDGNSSYFWADAEALGEDTFVAVDISTFVVEDELSLLTLSAVAIAA